MVIPIIHTKTTLRPKIILFSVITALILITIILLSSDLLLVMDYKILKLILIIALLSQLLFILYFVISKKYKELGKILVQDSELSIKMGKGVMVYQIKDMNDTRIFLNHYRNHHRKSLIGSNKYETGNFLIFIYKGKTRIYELLLKNRQQIDKFIVHLNNYTTGKKIQIFDD